MPEFGRNYPNQSLASHVLGYVGLDNVGLDGVEYSFNEELSPAAVSRADAPQAEEVFGNQVFLTIDADIQHMAERHAREALAANQADSVLVLVMEAGSGEILGYAAVPDFDPNEFNRFERSALRNLPLAQAYEPGSVFKIFSIASFLQLGGITPEDEFLCTGLYEKKLADGDTIRIRDLAAHGRVNAGLILKYSCNVGAAYASEKVQREAFYQVLLGFGFGRPTGLPLPGESAGILAPPARWSLRTKATISFGQEISVSAVQVLQAATAIANGGLLLAPRIVSKILSPSGELVKEFGRQPVREVISPQVAREVLEMMAVATEQSGTARRGAVQGVRISAKTGTAQVRDPATGTYSESNYVASYLGIFPTEEPRVIVYVVLHNPKGPAYYGSQIAAPVFRGSGRGPDRLPGHPPPGRRRAGAARLTAREHSAGDRPGRDHARPARQPQAPAPAAAGHPRPGSADQRGGLRGGAGSPPGHASPTRREHPAEAGMNLLSRNLRALYARHPGLQHLGLESAGDGPLAVETAACGLATAQLQGSYLHSRYDPREEARRQLARELPSRFGSAVFLGFGLGYLPEAFLELHPGRPLAVIEPEPALFRQALAARDLRGLLACPDASWLVGREAEEAVMELDEKAPGSPRPAAPPAAVPAKPSLLPQAGGPAAVPGGPPGGEPEHPAALRPPLGAEPPGQPAAVPGLRGGAGSWKGCSPECPPCCWPPARPWTRCWPSSGRWPTACCWWRWTPPTASAGARG